MSAEHDRRGFLVGAATVGAGMTAASLVPAPAEATAQAGDVGAAAAKVFTNNVGYEPGGPKRALITVPGDRSPGDFRLLDAGSGEVVHRGRLVEAGAVADWDPRRYWIADFSAVARPGDYIIAVGRVRSAPFKIEAIVLERYTLSHIVHHFKGWRCSGQFDKFDHQLPIGNTGRRYDAHGGWYDATGDFGKHFTGLSSLSYFNTLSIPLTAWSLFVSYRELTRRGDENFTQLRTWLLDEALYGACCMRTSRYAESSCRTYGW